MRLLHRYVFSAILGATLIVALAIAAISAALVFVDDFEEVGNNSFDLIVALQLVVLQLPRGIYELFPIIVLLGAILGLGGLASASELVAMRAAGISLFRLAASVLRVGLALVVISVFFSEWLAPRAEVIEHQLRAVHNLEDDWDSPGEGVWLRDGDSFIRVGTVISTKLLEEIHLYRFGPDHKLQIAVEADRAHYDNDSWKLLGVRYTEFRDGGIRSYQMPDMNWNTNLDPSLLQVSVMSPERQTMRTLYQYARYLDAYHMEAGAYKSALWSKAAVPVMMLIMAVLAIPFVMGPLRSTGAGQRMFVGMVVGVVFFLLNEVTLSTGRVYGLSPFMSAWLPTALLAGITMAWFAYFSWPTPIRRLLRPFQAG